MPQKCSFGIFVLALLIRGVNPISFISCALYDLCGSLFFKHRTHRTHRTQEWLFSYVPCMPYVVPLLFSKLNYNVSFDV